MRDAQTVGPRSPEKPAVQYRRAPAVGFGLGVVGGEIF